MAWSPGLWGAPQWHCMSSSISRRFQCTISCPKRTGGMRPRFDWTTLARERQTWHNFWMHEGVELVPNPKLCMGLKLGRIHSNHDCSSSCNWFVFAKLLFAALLLAHVHRATYLKPTQAVGMCKLSCGALLPWAPSSKAWVKLQQVLPI